MHLVIQVVDEAKDKERGEAKYIDIRGEGSCKMYNSVNLYTSDRQAKEANLTKCCGKYVSKRLRQVCIQKLWKCQADIKFQSSTQLSIIISCKLCI